MSRYSGNWIRPRKRHAIYTRDRHRCVWCGASVDWKAATLDHLYPNGHPRTGTDSSLLMTCCLPCNSRKQDMDPIDWLMVLVDSGHDAHEVLVRLNRRHLPLDLVAGQASLDAARAGRSWHAQGPAPASFEADDVPF